MAGDVASKTIKTGLEEYDEAEEMIYASAARLLAGDGLPVPDARAAIEKEYTGVDEEVAAKNTGKPL